MIFFVLLVSILASLEMKKQAVVTQTKKRKKGCARLEPVAPRPFSAGSRGIVRFRRLVRFVANFRAYDTYKTA